MGSPWIKKKGNHKHWSLLGLGERLRGGKGNMGTKDYREGRERGQIFPSSCRRGRDYLDLGTWVES